MKSHKSERGEGDVYYIAFMIAFFVLSMLIGAIYGWATQKNYVGTVDKTYVDGGNTFFVITSDGDPEGTVYQNEDAWFFLKWNSGDILRDLNVGSTYNFHTYGWRVQFLSWYPNIISASPVGQ